jgi:hypothetical protein
MGSAVFTCTDRQALRNMVFARDERIPEKLCPSVRPSPRPRGSSLIPERIGIKIGIGVCRESLIISFNCSTLQEARLELVPFS